LTIFTPPKAAGRPIAAAALSSTWPVFGQLLDRRHRIAAAFKDAGDLPRVYDAPAGS